MRRRPASELEELPGGTDDTLNRGHVAILDLHGPVLRVTGFDVPYPYWKIEDRYMPSVERVVGACRRLLEF